jgi:hypothetical protein
MKVGAGRERGAVGRAAELRVLFVRLPWAATNGHAIGFV